MEYARHTARLNEPVAGGGDARAHLMQAARMGNKKAIELLEGPELPDGMEYLWDWFTELNASRGLGVVMMSGTHLRQPLTYEVIFGWAQLMDHEDIMPHEVRALITLDHVYLHPEAGEKEREAERKEDEKLWT